jgi:phospholipid/cholesterol/gamma-HCH transport system substrate-binding protein
MAEKLSEVLAGAGVLAVAIGFAAYAGLGRDVTARGDSYEVKASFQAIDGVSVGTDVRVAGVKVGSVTRIELNPETYYADATFTVREGILIPDDSTALISSEGLLGGNFVEVQPGGSMTSVEPGGEILDTQGAVGLVRLMMKFVAGDAGGSEGAATP